MHYEIKHKHHYIPEFHLNAWKNETGSLLLYRKVSRGKVESRGKQPAQVCYKNDLYMLREDPFGSFTSRPDHVENELGKIDDNAAKVLAKILSGSSLSALSVNEKRDWAIYVNSLLHRSPERLEELDTLMRSTITKTLDDIKACAAEETHKTWDDCGRIFTESSYGINHMRLLLLSTINENESIDGLLGYEWNLLNLQVSFPFKFILTEMPVVTFEKENNIYMLALALTPSLLWFAFPRSLRNSEEFGEVVKHVVMVYNGVQLMRKPGFIISSAMLSNDGLHNYDNIFKEFLRPSVS
jgi:hypothetical protein